MNFKEFETWVEDHPGESILIGGAGVLFLMWMLGFFGGSSSSGSSDQSATSAYYAAEANQATLGASVAIAQLQANAATTQGITNANAATAIATTQANAAMIVNGQNASAATTINANTVSGQTQVGLAGISGQTQVGLAEAQVGMAEAQGQAAAALAAANAPVGIAAAQAAAAQAVGIAAANDQLIASKYNTDAALKQGLANTTAAVAINNQNTIAKNFSTFINGVVAPETNPNNRIVFGGAGGEVLGAAFGYQPSPPTTTGKLPTGNVGGKTTTAALAAIGQ